MQEKDFYENFIKYNGWLWILYGSAVTFIPLILMVIVGRFFLKIKFTISRNYERKLYRPSCIIIQYQLFRF